MTPDNSLSSSSEDLDYRCQEGSPNDRPDESGARNYYPECRLPDEVAPDFGTMWRDFVQQSGIHMQQQLFMKFFNDKMAAQYPSKNRMPVSPHPGDANMAATVGLPIGYLDQTLTMAYYMSPYAPAAALPWITNNFQAIDNSKMFNQQFRYPKILPKPVREPDQPLDLSMKKHEDPASNELAMDLSVNKDNEQLLPKDTPRTTAPEKDSKEWVEGRSLFLSKNYLDYANNAADTPEDKKWRFHCTLCKKAFTKSSSLENHLRIHSGEKPYSCYLCGARFVRSSTLKYHMMVHRGEVRYRCTMCNKAFRHMSHYKDHARIHTGYRPFACGECGRCFTKKSGWNSHVKSVHRVVRLDQCHIRCIRRPLGPFIAPEYIPPDQSVGKWSKKGRPRDDTAV